MTGGNTVTVNTVLWYSTPIAIERSPTAFVVVQHSLWGDPRFADAGDYHIGPGSAAIDTGVETGVTSDIDGEVRPRGRPDIGADEGGMAVLLPLVLKEF